MLATENWCVKVGEKIYGPYTSAQMRKYAEQGRVAGWSLVAPAGSRAWCEAKSETTFSDLFRSETNAVTATGNNRVFGKNTRTSLAQDSRQDITEKPDYDQRANFIIIFDVVSGAAGRNSVAIRELGPAFRITDNVWSLTCDLTAVGVRNALSPYLKHGETLFVIDSTRGRTAHHNFTPELHAKIAAVYAKRMNKAAS